MKLSTIAKTLLTIFLLLLMAGTAVAQTGIIASDNFQRTNELPLSNNGNWVTPVGFTPLQLIITGAVQPTALKVPSAAIWADINWPANQYSQITIGNGGVKGDKNYLIVLATASTQTYYELELDGPSGTQEGQTVWKLVNGAGSVVGSFQATVNTGDVWQMVAGTTCCTVTQNGLTRFTSSDSTIKTGVPGFGMYALSASGENRISAWQAGSSSMTNQNGPCGSGQYGTYTGQTLTPLYGSNVAAVSASNGQGIFYLSQSISTPHVNEQMSVTGLATPSTSPLNGSWIITSVGPPAGNPPLRPVTVTLPSTSISVAYTTVASGATFDTETQFISSVSLTSNVATVVAPNDFVSGQLVLIINSAAAGGVLNGTHKLLSATSTQFTFALTAANIGSTQEPDALARGAYKVIVSTTMEGQASGNLTCIPGNFVSGVTTKITTNNGTTTFTTSSPPYTPGAYNTLTADVANECDPPTCDGTSVNGPIITNTNGDVTYNEGNNIYEMCPALCNLFDFAIEMAWTKMYIPDPLGTPAVQWTDTVGSVAYTYGLFNQVNLCINNPDYQAPPISDPFLISIDQNRLPFTPPLYRWVPGLCERFNSSGPWTCVGIYRVHWPSVNPNRSFCTQNQ
jgi:hypothetical protein